MIATVTIVGLPDTSSYSREMARREVDSILAKLRQMSEEGLSSFFNEVMASERMRKGLGRAGERFLANKQSFDRNVETLLEFVNIPSKRDVRDLKSRLDTLSSQLVNLSMKVDRMAAEHGQAVGRVEPVDHAESAGPAESGDNGDEEKPMRHHRKGRGKK